MAFKLITTLRGQGKTRMLVDLVRGNPARVLVVHSVDERRRVLDVFRLPSGQVVTWEDRLQLRGRGDYELVVDNLDLILQGELGGVVSVVTATRPFPHCARHPREVEPCLECARINRLRGDRSDRDPETEDAEGKTQEAGDE